MNSCYLMYPPPCIRECVGEVVTKHKIYETRCYDIVKVCEVCGLEHPHMHPCPRCGGYGHPYRMY